MNSIHKVTIPIRAIDDLYSQDLSIKEFTVLSSMCAYTNSDISHTECPPGFIMERFKITKSDLIDIVHSLIKRGYLEFDDNGNSISGIKIIRENDHV